MHETRQYFRFHPDFLVERNFHCANDSHLCLIIEFNFDKHNQNEMDKKKIRRRIDEQKNKIGEQICGRDPFEMLIMKRTERTNANMEAD